MRLFFVLVCCLAIPLVARAADQDNQDNQDKKKKEKQTTQGQPQQQQAGQQGKHQGANRASQLNSPSQTTQGQQQQQTGKQGKHHGANRASQLNSPSQTTQGQQQQQQQTGKQGKHHGATNLDNAAQLNSPSPSQDQHPGVNAQNTNVPAVQSKTTGKVETKHFNLSNSPNPKIESVKFQQNYHIQGSENWQGPKYVVFQNYKSESHDQGWWHSHYNRVVLISGGWYAWNAGYWYPAWGYDPAVAYYPYDGPIYGYNDLPPDQVIANVQSALQAQGYYQGEVDGLLGPITRAALANYQRDHGLYTTEAIDEPTLESLGMS